jgi:hypothetical protein
MTLVQTAPSGQHLPLPECLEALVWLPPAYAKPDLVETYLLLTPSGQLPSLEPAGHEWCLPVSTKEAAQRIVLLARGQGIDARWSQTLSTGRHVYRISRLLLDDAGRDRLLHALRRADCVAADRSDRLSGDRDAGTARALWRACLLSRAYTARRDGSILASFPTSRRARWAHAAAHALGLEATVLSSRPEQRHRVLVRAPHALALVEQLMQRRTTAAPPGLPAQ